MSKDAFKFTRLGILIGLGAALYIAGTRPELQVYFELDYLRSLADDAGLAGMATFVGIFAGGYLMQIPGLVFVVAALLGWGPVNGGILAFFGSTLASALSFGTVRTVGGSPLADVENKWVRKLLSKLDDHPVRTVFLLRTFFYMNPVMNLPLVLSGVKFRDYFIGSVFGFVIPLAVVIAALDTVMAWLSLG